VRLDVAIDGIGNTVQQLDVVADPLGESNPFGNAFHLAAKDLATEREAQAHLNLETGRTWKFTNSSVRNFLGDPVGYKFSPGDNAFPFASPDAWWRRRASYVDHHVWVTPYREDEQYAAGYYPNQSTGGDGLPALTAANRSILNTGVVF
jgi:primary-amine oxidase